MQETEDLIQQAKMVLDFNWTGQYTKPGPRLYPHQWSRDSALIAIGYSRYDEERAIKELTHLFDAQWKNGLLPQIVFNPRFGMYFPGIEFWHASESPDAPRAPRRAASSNHPSMRPPRSTCTSAPETPRYPASSSSGRTR